MIVKCSKCNRPSHITYFNTAKIELCLDCSIAALELLKVEFPSYRKFIETWTQKKD